MKLFRCLILFLLLVAGASAKTNWFTQSGAGAQDGTSLANAWSASFFNTGSNWASGAGKISPGDSNQLRGTFTVQLSVHGDSPIIQGDGRLTGVGTAATWTAGTTILLGITAGTFNTGTILDCEFRQLSSANTYNAITLAGTTGWLIQDNYIHDTYYEGVGFSNTADVNSSTIVRHNLFVNIGGITSGSQSPVVIDLKGNKVLVEYNTIRGSLDRCRLYGTGSICRNNYWGATDTVNYPNTSRFPEHVDGFQSFEPGPLIQFSYERNYDVDNTDSVPWPNGGNAHLFLVQDAPGTNGFTWHLNRFNVGIRTGGGGPDWQNVSHVYTYNLTLASINKYLADNSRTYGGALGYTYPNTHTSATSDLADARNIALVYSPGTLGNNSSGTSGPFEFLPTNFSSGTLFGFNSSGSQINFPLSPSPANLSHTAPLFTDGLGTAGHDDYSLTSGSPLKNTGSGYVTEVGSLSGTSLTVSNAQPFVDGQTASGWVAVDADWIFNLTTGGSPVQITSINYTTNVVTLAGSRTGSNGDKWVVKGQQDVGALPFSYYTTVMTVTSGTTTVSPTTLSAATTTIEDVRKAEWLYNGVTVATTNYTGSSPLTATYTPSGAGTLETRVYNYWASEAYGSVSVFQLINQDPSSLATGTVSISSIPLTWTLPVAADSTSIEQSLDGSTGWAEVATPAAGATSATILSLSPATTYYFRSRAVNGGVYSGYSGTVNATTSGTPTASSSGVRGKAVLRGTTRIR